MINPFWLLDFRPHWVVQVHRDGSVTRQTINSESRFSAELRVVRSRNWRGFSKGTYKAIPDSQYQNLFGGEDD